MQVLSRKTLREFWERHPDAKTPLTVWYGTVKKANWANFADVKAAFRFADAVGDSRLVFNVGGNKYRVIARISYKYQRVMIKFVGTHAEYDKVDAESV